MDNESMMEWQTTPPAAEINAVYNPAMLERRRPRDEFEIPNMPGGWIDYYTERQFNVEDVVQFQHLAKPSIITCAKQAVGQAKRRCVQIAVSAVCGPIQLFTMAQTTAGKTVNQIVRQVRRTQAARRRRPRSPRHSPRTSPRQSPRTMAPIDLSDAAPTTPPYITPIDPSHAVTATPPFPMPITPPRVMSYFEGEMAMTTPNVFPPSPTPSPPSHGIVAFCARAEAGSSPSTPSRVMSSTSHIPVEHTTDAMEVTWSAPSRRHWLDLSTDFSFIDLNQSPPKTPISPRTAVERQLLGEFEDAMSYTSESSRTSSTDLEIPVTPPSNQYSAYMEEIDADFSSNEPEYTPEPSSIGPPNDYSTPAPPLRMPNSKRMLISPIATSASMLSAPLTTSKPKLPSTPQHRVYPSYMEATEADFSSGVDFSPNVTGVTTQAEDLFADITELSSNCPFSPEVGDDSEVQGSTEDVANNTTEPDPKIHDTTEFSSYCPFPPEVENDLEVQGNTESVANKNTEPDSNLHDDTEFSSYCPFPAEVENDSEVQGNTEDVANNIEHDSNHHDNTEFSSYCPFPPEVENDSEEVQGNAEEVANNTEPDSYHHDNTEFSSYCPFPAEVEDALNIQDNTEFSSYCPFPAELENDSNIHGNTENVANTNGQVISTTTENIADTKEGAIDDIMNLPTLEQGTSIITDTNEGVIDDIMNLSNLGLVTFITEETANTNEGVIDDNMILSTTTGQATYTPRNITDTIESAVADVIIPPTTTEQVTSDINNIADTIEGAYDDLMILPTPIAGQGPSAVDNITDTVESADDDVIFLPTTTGQLTSTINNIADTNEGASDDIMILPTSTTEKITSTIENIADTIEGASDDIMILSTSDTGQVTSITENFVDTNEGAANDIMVLPHPPEYVFSTSENVADNNTIVDLTEDVTKTTMILPTTIKDTPNTPKNVADASDNIEGFSSYITDFSNDLADYSPGRAFPGWFQQVAVKKFVKNDILGSRRTTRNTEKYELEETKRKEERRQRNIEKAKISALSEEWETKVREAVSNGFAPNYKASDFARVVPPQHGCFTDSWLNDETVNGYLKLITKYHNTHHNSVVPKSHAFASFMFKQIDEKGYQGVSRWAKRAKIGGANLLKTHTIFIPVNSGSHWTLMVVYPGARTAHYYDSMGRSRYDNGRRWFDLLKIWLRGELGSHYKEGEWSFFDKESPQQTNSSDCGVFAVTTAKMLILGSPVMEYGPADIPLQRKRIVAELVNGNFL